ncbi:endonuclease/exonuclease/phosphatase family protein [Aurantimonas sp. A3-2-R12]|uniref:endonuclease/exonuclease/phosphatase family protein n=1 Tax=Aurantimonas sp. A3-2-R12 TaxID=3114362 RepID=UPI002E176F03|nr:endonuclease/exonuclease/phosphatase family protein [Aurantimonas sp. A3-2-R12]
MIRVLSYNIHRCIGTDRKLSPERIAEVIAECNADIVALQEVDVGRRRTGAADQAADIARLLGMMTHFHPALTVQEEQYGDAILTRRPSRLMQAGPLPGLAGRPNLEPRGALWVSVDVAGKELQVINTHFGLNGGERLRQAETVLGGDWLAHPRCQDPAVLIGDFNAVPRSRAYRRLAQDLSEARHLAGNCDPGATFPSRLPLLRIDHAFLRGAVSVRSVRSIRTPLTRVASDHLPLLLELELTPSPPVNGATR